MPRTSTGSGRNFYRYLSTLTHSEQEVLIIRREQVRLHSCDLNQQGVNFSHRRPISGHQNNVMHAGVNLNHQVPLSDIHNNGMFSAVNLNQHGVNLNHQRSVSGHLNNGLLERLGINSSNAANSSTPHIPFNVNVINSTSSYGLNENELNDTACQPTVTPQTRISDRQDCSYLPRKRNKPNIFNEKKIFTSWFIKFKVYVRHLSKEEKLKNLIMLLDRKLLDDLELYPKLSESYEDLSMDSAAREFQLHLCTKPRRINDPDEYVSKLEKLVDIIERGSFKKSMMRRKLDLLVDTIPNKCKSKCVFVRHSTFRKAVTYVKKIWNYDLIAPLSTKSNNSILNSNQPPNSNKRDKAKRHENANGKENSQIKCHGCGKIGHFRPRCPENSSNEKTELKAIEVQVNDIIVVALCDTGTNVVTVHPELANHFGLKKDKLIRIGTIARGESEKLSNQPITVNYNFKSAIIKETMIAAQPCSFSLYQLIIGNQLMKNLGLEINVKNLSISETTQSMPTSMIIQKEKETFIEDEFIKIIKHNGDVGPGKVYVEKMEFELRSSEAMKMYPIPENLKNEHIKLVKQMLALDVIDPSTSSKI
uniref:CCHC-type domain-containing protein n=1 Tax=Strongyloides venezuelensis TaxID=75913 RepID=A0A0K0FQE6_STRVS